MIGARTSPELVAQLADLAARRAADFPARAVAVFGPHFPLEIPHALGLDPALLAPGADGAAAAAGEEFARADSCPHCRALAGSAAAGASWLARTSAVVAVTACDQQRRALEALGRWGGLKIVSASLPRTASANARERWLLRIDEMTKDLEALAGRRLDAVALRESARTYAALRSALSTLRALMDFPNYLRAGCDSFFLGPERALPALQAARLPERPEPAVRMFLTGSCLGRADAAGFEKLAPSGAEIVADLAPIPGGLLGVRSGDGAAGVRALAEACLDAPEIGRRPNDSYFRALRDAVAGARAAAVLFRCLKFCDACSSERLRIKAELAPIPVTLLDDEGGAGEGAAGRENSRLGAQVEAIRCRRA